MKIKLLLVSGILLAVLSGCGSAHKTLRPTHEEFAAIKSLAVVVKQEKDFEVIYSRATANGTGAVLFGVAGAAIGAGIDEGQDKEKAKAMRDAVSGICCQTNFSEALSVLQDNDRFEKVYLAEKQPIAELLNEYDAVVTFTINQWGLRLVEQNKDIMACFVEIMIAVQDASTRKQVWSERHVVIGQGRDYLRHYMSDAGLLQNELKQTIQETGVRMSNLLIYQ